MSRRQKIRDLVVVLTIAVAIVRARLIVVADDKSRPTRGGIDRCNLLAEFGGRQFVDRGKQKIHGQLEFVIAFAVVGIQFRDIRRPGLADQNRVVFIRNLAQSAQDVVHFGQLLVVFLLFDRIAEGVFFGTENGIVVQLWIFKY